ncbi:MAG: DUF2085 domain-containing protein [Ignavibacteria bacterium]
MNQAPDIKPYYRVIYATILIIAFLWCAGIIAAPLWKNETDVRGGVSQFLYTFYSKSCHQLDDRSLHIAGNKLGTCARCTTIYFGFLLTTILYPLVKNLGNLYLPPIGFLLFGALLVALDAGLDTFDILKNTFTSREITGAIIGLLLPFYIIPGTIRLFHEFFTPPKIVPKK